MKKLVILGLVSILLLPLLAIGCSANATTETTSYLKEQTIAISLDEFAAQNHIVKNIDLALLGDLTVKLGSNPTTGYSWGEWPSIDQQDICNLISHRYEEPTNTDIVGAGGTDVWEFKGVLVKDTTTIKFSYSRPWEGGEKDLYTLTVNVTVK
jgi:predicted secreted protein